MKLFLIVATGMGVITTLTWMIIMLPMTDDYPGAYVRR